jgi:2-amino-4-hydroxy-6-hydroxymethyldihydropteridine diphosphokinase
MSDKPRESRGLFSQAERVGAGVRLALRDAGRIMSVVDSGSSSGVVAFVALGSNQGDRRGHLDAAVSAIDAIPGTRITAISLIRETDPVGPPGQSTYLNGVVSLTTALAPLDLLSHLLGIERSRGRVRPDLQRWGPRTLDLDLLLHGQTVMRHDDLTLPHPRLHERVFVLEPLHDLAPDLVVPGLGTSVKWLLARAKAGGT